MTVEQLLSEAVKSGLHEIVLRESVGGWQAIAKFHGALSGPWNVGCDTDAIAAVSIALKKTPAKSTDSGGIFD